MKYANNITELIGNTPLVKLQGASEESGATVLGKCEFMNPSHSVKDRIGTNMINTALEQGLINKETTVIEPTSGNTGIALAGVCAALGIKLILTMPSSMSIERRRLLKALGADLVLTEPEKGMKGAIDKAVELSAKTENSFIPQQFGNLANPEIHRLTTAKEIIADTDVKVYIFFSAIVTGVQDIVNTSEYNIMICLSNESYEKEKLNIQMMANGSVDGLLVSIAKETLEKGNFDHFKELKDYDIPLTLFDRVSDEIECDKVIVDDIGGGYKATRHLLDQGCKRIAILSTPNHVNVGALRTLGYKRALEERKIEVDDNLIFKVDDKSDMTEQINSFMNQKGNGFDGVLAVNEIYAAIIMKILKEREYKIPGDVAVVGFTDGLISSFSSPALSTIDQHGMTIGEQSAELLLDRIQKKRLTQEYETKVVSTDLRIRKSSQIPK